MTLRLVIDGDGGCRHPINQEMVQLTAHSYEAEGRIYLMRASHSLFPVLKRNSQDTHQTENRVFVKEKKVSIAMTQE